MTALDSQASRENLDVGRVLKRAFGAMRDRALVLFLFALVTIGVVNTIFVLLRHAGVLTPPPGDLGAMRGAPGENIAVGLVTAYFYGGAIAAVLATFRERAFTVADGFTSGSRNLWRMVGVSVLANLLIFVGLLLLLVPGILLWTRWYAAQPIAVVENRGVLNSMGRSAKLTDGRRFSIFLVGFVLLVIALVLAILIGGILYFVGDALGAGELIGDLLGEFIGLALFAVLDAAGKTVVYDELVRIREGGRPDEVSQVFA